MSRGALLHVRRLGRAAAIEPRAITPFGIELDAIRRVGNKQQRFRIAEQSCNVRRIGAVAADQPMTTQYPEIAALSTRIFGRFRDLIFVREPAGRFLLSKQPREFFVLESN